MRESFTTGTSEVNVRPTEETARMSFPNGVIREVVREDGQSILKYSAPDGNTFVKGGLKDKHTFQLLLIRNRQDPNKGLKNLSDVLSILEADLQAHGVDTIITTCKLRLAPLVVKRYGFESTTGLSYEEIEKRSKSWRKHFPYYFIPLRKAINH